MEWVLQVVDEIDDAIGALRLCSLGISAEIGLVVAAGLGMGAIGAAVVRGAEITLICSVLMLFSLAGVLKIRGSRLPTEQYPAAAKPDTLKSFKMAVMACIRRL